MKNFKIYVIVYLLFNYFNASAQEVELKLSDEIKIEKSKILTGLLHADDSGYYVSFEDSPFTFYYSIGLTSIMKEIYIKKYNKKFKEVYSKTYKVSEQNFYSLGVQYIKNKFIWLQYKVDNEKNLVTYYAVPISLDGKLQKSKVIGTVKYESTFEIPKVTWKISADTTHMIFVAESDYNLTKDTYGAYCSVVNSDLDIVWDKKVEFQKSQFRVEASSFELGPDNNIYFVAKIYNENASGISKMFSLKHQYDMYLMKVSSEKTKKLKLDLEEKFINGIKVTGNQYGSEVNCTAIIGDTKFGPIQGLSYLTLDSETGDVKFAKKRNFTLEELDSFGKKYTSKDGKDGKRGLNASFALKDVINKEDGSFTVLIEDNEEGFGDSRATFNNNHIIVANIDKEGNVGEVHIIPKRYSKSKKGNPYKKTIYEELTHYMFFSTLNAGDNIYYLYNDNEKNFERNITDPDRYRNVTNFRECVAVIAHFDERGELQRKVLFKKEDTGAILMPKFSTEISQNELFVFLKRRKSFGKNAFRLGVLSVD